jgi:hypothetical protein
MGSCHEGNDSKCVLYCDQKDKLNSITLATRDQSQYYQYCIALATEDAVM